MRKWRHLPYGLAVKPHENVPFLLITNVSQTGCDIVLFNKGDETVDVLVFGIDMLSESDIASGVFMAVVYDGAVRKCSEIAERSVHLCTVTFEETTTSSNEECVACEDCTRLVWLVLVRDVVTYRVLSVAWRCETSDGQSVRGSGQDIRRAYLT